MSIWAFPSFYPYDHPGLKWYGIFAHRQFKGLIANGADLKVIQPVQWHPGGALSDLHPDWKRAKELNYPPQRVYDGIQVYHPRIQNLKPSRIFTKPYNERYVAAIVSFFRSNAIRLDPAKDIFYSQWVPDAALVQQAAHQLGIRSAVLVIGDDVLVYPKESGSKRDLFINTWQQADVRLAVAGYLGNEANALAGAALPFHTVRRGVDHAFFKPATAEEKLVYRKEFGLPADKMVILTIGSPIVRKGWLDLLDALKDIDNEDLVLAGVCSGPKDIDLQEEVNKRGLTDRFIMLGEVAPEKINRVYNAADIFCLPSHWEGIANGVVEAMSSGLPVITTDVCGHPELVTDGVTGIMIPPKQVDTLRAKLLLLLNDAGKRSELGANARNFIVEEWGSFQKNAARLYDILMKAMQG